MTILIYCYWNAIGFYWHEHTELALVQSRNDNCFDCSLESCQNASVPRQQSTEANAWPSRKSMGIQPLSRLYKNPLIVFCGNHSWMLWVDRSIANHPTRGNSDCTGRKQHLHLGWLDTHRLLLSHTQTSMKCFWKSVFAKTDVCWLWENKPWLQTNTIITFRTTYYDHTMCVCVLLPFAKIRCEVAFVNYCTSGR